MKAGAKNKTFRRQRLEPLSPKPQTLNLIPNIKNPKPQTPKTQTPNPKPQALKPKALNPEALKSRSRAQPTSEAKTLKGFSLATFQGRNTALPARVCRV